MMIISKLFDFRGRRELKDLFDRIQLGDTIHYMEGKVTTLNWPKMKIGRVISKGKRHLTVERVFWSYHDVREVHYKRIRGIIESHSL